MVNKETKSVLLIVFLVILNYANTLNNQFVWDDHDFIVEREEIRHLSSIPSFFTKDVEGVYRPVREIFYVLSYTVWKLNPFGYHLDALLIHIFVSLLVYFIIASTLGSRIALMVALLFAAHPIHTEAITYITTSFDEIGVIFFLLSLYFYIKSENRWKYIASIISALLAFFTYEITLTLPAVIVLYDYCFRKIDSKKIRGYIPFFVADFFYLFIRFFVVEVGARKAEYWISPYITFINMFKVFLKYILMSFVPYDLNAHHTILLSNSISELGVLIPYFCISLLIALLVALRKHRAIFFAGAWFFITLLPVSNIIPIQTLMAERYLYLPSLGTSLLLALGFEWLSNSFPKRKKILAFLFLILLSYYAVTTIQRNNEWKDDFTLWSITVKASPLSYKAHMNLGREYSLNSMYDEAINEYQLALEIADIPSIHSNLGVAYYNVGQRERALEELRNAINMDPDDVTAHYNLGNVYFKEGLLEMAIDEYEKALELGSRDQKLKHQLADAHNELGIVYGSSLSYLEAIAEFRRAVEVEPDFAEAHSNLGTAYVYLGEYALAREELKKAIELDPYNPTYMQNLEKIEALEGGS